MERLAGPLFATFVVLLALAVVGAATGHAGVLVDVTMALLGLGFLAGSALSFAEVGQRAAQLVRFELTDVVGVPTVAALPDGSHWLRTDAVATPVDGTVEGVLADRPAVAVTVRGEVRERFAGLPWPSTGIGHRFERTDAVPMALEGAGREATLAATGDAQWVGHDVRVVGGERATLWDDAPPHARRALADHGIDVADETGRGRVFERYVRVDEATVPASGTVRLFGPVDVERGADGPVLVPAGRFTSRPLLTTEGWGAIRRRLLRRLGVLAFVGPLTGAGGLLLLWLAVPSLLGW